MAMRYLAFRRAFFYLLKIEQPIELPGKMNPAYYERANHYIYKAHQSRIERGGCGARRAADNYEQRRR